MTNKTPSATDLVERLLWDAKNVEFARSRPIAADCLSGREHGTMREAADTITRLQAALETIAKHKSGVSENHTECENCKDAYLEPYCRLKDFARTALRSSVGGE